MLSHIGYDESTMDNDIALLKLKGRSTLTPMQLIDPAETGAQNGDVATVIGWGHLAEGGPSSFNALQQVSIPIQGTQQCQKAYQTTITPNMVCAGTDGGGVDSCQGDSGGPLMVQAETTGWQQAGVVSFGIGCARPGVFGVYTRVARYLDWIEACKANPPS